jgi:hypothetical protein
MDPKRKELISDGQRPCRADVVVRNPARRTGRAEAGEDVQPVRHNCRSAAFFSADASNILLLTIFF